MLRDLLQGVGCSVRPCIGRNEMMSRPWVGLGSLVFIVGIVLLPGLHAVGHCDSHSEGACGGPEHCAICAVVLTAFILPRTRVTVVTETGMRAVMQTRPERVCEVPIPMPGGARAPPFR